MTNMGALIQLYLLVVAVGLALSQYSGPFLSTSVDNGCFSECTAGIPAGNATFDENVKYVYNFSGKTSIVAPTEDSKYGTSEISITGKANVIGTKNCGAIVYLKYVEITQGSKTYRDTKLEGYPILISYNNGRVGPQICTTGKDSVASMNLKRAIVSAFQISSAQNSELLETDIQGTCTTTYTSSSTDTYNEIDKYKNLIYCSGYDKISLLASQSDQNYKDSPFSEATQQSKILLVQSLIRTVTTQETFLYQPLGPMGLVTSIKTTMDLNLKKRSPIRVPSLNLEKAQSIVFAKPPSTVETASADQLFAATRLAMKNLEPVVETDGAKYCEDLVNLLKVASKDDILSAYQQVKSSAVSADDNKNEDVAETLFIDALIAANSGQSIEAVVELIKNDQLSKPLAVSWFINLAKAKQPTKEALVLASSLLNDKVFKEGYMGFGALLRKYLKDTHDYDSPEVINTLRNLAAPLQKMSDGLLSVDDEETVIASLKGLENGQYINSDIEDLIVQTIMNKDASQRTRAMALAVAKTFANYPKIENVCESVFMDASEDSELRILAFKAYALYASNKKAAVIKSVLDDKNGQLQIQSYILSYLNNLKTTVNESKLDQKNFYQGIKSVSSKKSLNDILRYSQNVEYYHNCPVLQSGALLNSDIIYSYKSFLPRSYSASLKTFIFGRQQNIFDFDVRVENIERMLEKLFGPEGHFAQSNDHPASDVANYIIQAIKYAKQRSLNNVDSEMSQGNGDENTSMEEDMNKIYVDVALKVLGNDIGWFAFQGMESKITYRNIIDAMIKHFDSSALSTKQDIELNVRRHLPIIDFDKKYAACSGLPISIKMQSTAAIKLNMATNFDLKSYTNQLDNSNFALKFIPSGSFTGSTVLTINGFVVDAGFKIASTFHSSTGSDVSIKTVKGRGFEIVYGLPLNVMDVFSLETGAFRVVQESGSPSSETPMDTDVRRQSYSRTFDNLVSSTGLALSVEYDFPWDGTLQSLYPYSGSSKLSLKLLKLDENLTKYVMKVVYDLNSPTLKYARLVFVTPKADISRGVELFAAYENQPNKKFIAKFRTPSTSVVLQSTLVDTDAQKTIDVQYSDGAAEHDFSLGATCEALDEDTVKYSPVVGAVYSESASDAKQTHPFVPMFDVEGHVIVKYTDGDDGSRRPRKVTLQDLALVTPGSRHSLQGSVTAEGNEIKSEGCLTNGRINITAHAYLGGQYPVYKASGAFDMVRNEPSAAVGARQLQLAASDEIDEPYRPASKLFALLYGIKTLNMFTSQELRVETPYKFITENYVLWDDDHVDLNVDFTMENGDLTIHGNASTTDLLDLASYANITVLPRTSTSGISIIGHAEHRFVSDSSDNGFIDVKYEQDKDKTGSSLEIKSECPSIAGVFYLSTQNHFVDDELGFILNYNIQHSTSLSIDLNANPNQVDFNLNFDCPEYPYYNSYVIARGWSETQNVYSFNTKFLWPGIENLNYLNADGKILLNQLESKLRGKVDWPSANLENVQVSIESNPDPEVQGGGIATVRCVSSKQILFSEKLKYTLSINDGEYVVSGESIQDGSKNYIPINFAFKYKNDIDQTNKFGREMTYKLVLERNGQTIVHQKLIQITNNLLVYRQIHRIDNDEQQISLDLEYDYTGSWNWYYNLKSKIVSPSVFQLLVHDDHNALECDSSVKINGFSIDTGHALNIFKSDALFQSYELKWFINNEQTALKYGHGQREIRGSMQYSLDSIDGGYKYTLSGDLCLDYNKDPDAKSRILVDTYYSVGDNYDSLATASNLRVYVPLFNDKEMSIKTDVKVLKSWENPLYAKLDLDIFPTTEQTLEIETSLNRENQDNGVLYSAELQAISEGMELDYLIKDSVFVSSEKWAKYIEASFIDSDNTERPLQLQFELVPNGLTTKINVLDIAVINVDTKINITDSLDTKSSITYNGIPYSVTLKLTSYPTVLLILGWNDKLGRFEQLKIEGSITMDDSTAVSITHITNNGQDVTSVGSVKKSLERENWWETDNKIDSDQLNLVWRSLKREFIERFIMFNSNLKNIQSVLRNQRKVRFREAKRAKPQFDLLINYINDEQSKIIMEIMDDEYLSEIPMLTLNCTIPAISDLVDLIEYMDADDCKNVKANIAIYTKDILHYYLEKTKSYLDLLYRGHVKLHSQLNYALTDLLNILNKYTDKPVNDLSSSEPHSLKDYINDIIRKLIITIQELKITIENLHDASEDYIKNLPIYDMFYDQIEKLKTYPYKDKLWDEIHKQLLELEVTAPTKDFANFINALDKYIDMVIHDIPVDPRDLINLRNKTIIVVKSFIFEFSDYVSYDRGMSVYNALRKVNNIGKTVLYIVSPSSFQNPSEDQSSFLDYRFLYKRYLKPSNLLPPFKAQGVIVGYNNIMTYNGQSYTIMPNTGTYILAKDFVNNKFSILANYDGNVLSSITVTTDNGNTYELLSGGTITVNGETVALPFVNQSVKAWKDVYFFGIKVAVGISIKCTLPLDIVEIFVNGYYFGRVHGLLGSMNQEPSFDFNLPNGEKSNSKESFVLAYRTNGNTMLPTVINPVQTDQKPCSNLFSGVSSLKPIFQTVSPMSYRAICNQIVSTATSEQDGLEKACLVAKAYVSMAIENYVSGVSIPEMCIISTVNDQTVNARSTVQISAPNDVADVMILIEEVAEDQKALSNILKLFMDRIVKNFNYKKIEDINFIIVGYSENSGDSNVHIYTANQDTDLNELFSNNMPEWSSVTSPSPPQSSSSLLSQIPDDLYAPAIKYAENSRIVQSLKKIIGEKAKDKAYKLSANYPYRPNAIKSVVSLVRSLYDISSPDVSVYTFDYVASSYAELGIKFYLIAPINLACPSDSDIFGVGELNTIYTMSAPKGKEINDGYTYDKSLETDLVLKTNGAMYDTQFFANGTSSQQNYFLRSLCRTIVYSAVKDPSTAKSCSASLLNGVMPYVKCINVVD